MKYTKNAITQLKRQYRSVLLKCALINAALFMATAPTMAMSLPTYINENVAANQTITNEYENIYINGPVENNGTISTSYDVINEGEYFANNNQVTALGVVENDAGTFINNSNGKINSHDVSNNIVDELEGTFINFGTINGSGADSMLINEATFLNGIPDELSKTIFTFTTTQGGSIHDYGIFNQGHFYNNSEINAYTIANASIFRNTGTISLSDQSQNNMGPTDAIEEEEEDAPSALLLTSRTFYNGATFEEIDDRDYLTSEPSPSLEPDDEEESSYNKITLGTTEKAGIINGDIYNGYFGVDGNYQDGYLNGFLNNGVINGDFWNDRDLFNGLVGSLEYNYTEDDYNLTSTLAGLPSAQINANVAANSDILYNGGTITVKDILLNRSELINGIDFFSLELALEFYDSQEDTTDTITHAISNTSTFASATITAQNGIYNNGYIINGGQINGTIYNGTKYSGIYLLGGQIDGDVLTGGLDGTTLAKKFKKFDFENNWEFSDLESVTAPEEGALLGNIVALGNSSEITGNIATDSVTVMNGASLGIGGDVTAHTLTVGEDLKNMFRESSVDEDSQESETPKEISSRLDIGTGTVTVGKAKFAETSTLALTINSEKEHGKLIAGQFDITSGATLEATVLPGFSEIDKPYTLQLLALDENSSLIPSEEEHLEDMSEEETDTSVEDTGTPTEEDNVKGFNHFSDNFLGEDGETIDNNMFEIKRIDDEGNYSITQLKTAEDIIIDPDDPDPTPKQLELSGMAAAWLDNGAMPTPGGLAVQSELANLAQNGSRKEFSEALKALAPNDSPVTQAMSTAVMGHVFGGVATHLGKPQSGLASGDALDGVSAWGSTYYGNAKLDDRADDVYGFDADSKGITVGADKKITSSVKLGLGLQYDKSDITAFKRDVDAETIAVFGYGEYRPSNWYVSGIVAYGHSDYDEKKFVGTQTVKANYNADLLGAQLVSGYDINTHYADITPNGGLRYNYIKRHGYEDSANQSTSGSNNDILTGVAGLRIAKRYGSFHPSAYVNFVYDMISKRDSATIGLPNGASYTVSGKRLNQFGTEAGVEIEYNYGNWDITANYDYAGRKHFNSHTGMLTAKYHF